MKLKYRDDMHAYWLDGKRCRGVSTVAKIPDDTFSLDQWRKRMVLLGVARKPELAKRAAAHHDDKGKLNEIAEEALLVAGSSDAAEAGTATHRIIERHVLGQEVLMNEEAASTIERYSSLLKLAGLTPNPRYVETAVVYPDLRICGRFDHLMLREHDESMVVVDVKTGASAVDYPHATAIQLAAYAHAPLYADLPIGRDGTTEKFADPPAGVDLETGYVLSIMPDDIGLYAVNLKAGWAAFQDIVLPTLTWRGYDRAKLIKRVA